VLYLLTVPANNERGPRYMEKALAAIHQARLRHPVTFMYGNHEDQVGLLLSCHPTDRDAVLEPIIANYPQACVTMVEGSDRDKFRDSWSIDAWLRPEIFPILRHAQFEDSLNHSYADPVSVLLRSILPDTGLAARIEIVIRPASRHRTHGARKAIRLLERELFRHHHRLASYFARHITRRRGWFLAWLLGFAAICTSHPPPQRCGDFRQPAS